jgi:hypothetical protein
MLKETPLRTLNEVSRQCIAEYLLNLASSYLMWVVGHEGESEMIAQFLPSLEVFRSHFMEWSTGLTTKEICGGIPVVSWGRMLYDPRESSGSDPRTSLPPFPPAVAQVVTLATQWKLLRDTLPSAISQLSNTGVFEQLQTWNHLDVQNLKWLAQYHEKRSKALLAKRGSK